MDKEKIIQEHKDDKVLQTAFTGEKILYEFIGDDNVTYWVIQKQEGQEEIFDVVPAATLSAPPLSPFVPRIIKAV